MSDLLKQATDAQALFANPTPLMVAADTVHWVLSKGRGRPGPGGGAAGGARAGVADGGWGVQFNVTPLTGIAWERDGAVLTCGTLAAYNGATAYVPGDKVLSGGTNYYCIANTTGNAPPNATYWYAMPADGTYEIPTPYLTADLDTLTYAASSAAVSVTLASATGHTGGDAAGDSISGTLKLSPSSPPVRSDSCSWVRRGS